MFSFISESQIRYPHHTGMERNECGKYFSEEKNLEKIAVLSNGFRNINAVREKDPQLALTLFFDLKNRTINSAKLIHPTQTFSRLMKKRLGANPSSSCHPYHCAILSVHASIHSFFFSKLSESPLIFSHKIDRNFVWVVGANESFSLNHPPKAVTYPPTT